MKNEEGYRWYSDATGFSGPTRSGRRTGDARHLSGLAPAVPGPVSERNASHTESSPGMQLSTTLRGVQGHKEVGELETGDLFPCKRITCPESSIGPKKRSCRGKRFRFNSNYTLIEVLIYRRSLYYTLKKFELLGRGRIFPVVRELIQCGHRRRPDEGGWASDKHLNSALMPLGNLLQEILNPRSVAAFDLGQ
jgi:hypothetical protein